MASYVSGQVRIHFREVGDGFPLLLVHGWGASGAEWDEYGWLAALRGRRLLVPDVRGHGASDRPFEPAAYEMDQLARDVIALADAVGASTFDLFGYSMGAAIALWTAVLDPGRVRALIAGGVTGESPDGARALARELRGELPLSARGRTYRDYALKANPDGLDALIACLESGLPTPPCAELAVFGGEALLFAGDLDRRAEHTRAVASCLPGGRFLLLPGLDHMGAFGDPRAHRAVDAFLGEVADT
ncbi:MAG TPA: alpha/beta hydrolase [Chloroflexota bacterium]|nr:alpha/beta hydrolase [Chloroflexota bacterium]